MERWKWWHRSERGELTALCGSEKLLAGLRGKLNRHRVTRGGFRATEPPCQQLLNSGEDAGTHKYSLYGGLGRRGDYIFHSCMTQCKTTYTHTDQLGAVCYAHTFP